MTVQFTHPFSSDTFRADVAPECTGATAVQGLIHAKFLEQRNHGHYDLMLARTEAPIGPNATLGSCGVREGDQIHVFCRAG